MTLKQQIQYQFKCSRADFILNVFMMIHEPLIHVLQGEKLFLNGFIAFYSMIIINFALLGPPFFFFVLFFTATLACACNWISHFTPVKQLLDEYTTKRNFKRKCHVFIQICMLSTSAVLCQPLRIRCA